MHWYLLRTRPRQEKRTQEYLEQQGYQCYLPVAPSEKLRQNLLTVADEPLFPRYLFIRLDQGDFAKGWGPIRSTRGVGRLVSFDTEPARADDSLVEFLRAQETDIRNEPGRLFKPSDRGRIIDGSFADIEGVYQMADGEHRVMVLIELLCKWVAVPIPQESVRRVGQEQYS